ncbi:DUF262 domain-containing protein [Paenibacillus typhae]|uniref:DUF262 domain-containing protein n=1 Tax=Paenibacillus typhae TaxID=1174501 RepID=UPI001C8D7BCC|nr:DUF262 domain-containing protein [Paenibacillus typhae]MBY0011628.1 DUF262 domain-containing protein [Paenibacillus typhae]
MLFKFQRNTLTIKEIYDDFKGEKLMIDKSYQRRKVWATRDNIRLIETILLNWIVPEIFLWPADINPDTGETVTHIVDGQQRINAIIDYISGTYKLNSRYLLSKENNENFADRYFTELPSELKKNIWMYSLSIVNIDRNCTIKDVKHMFYRLNLTDYSLNEQEKRHSLETEFGTAAKELSTDEFWEKHKVFSTLDLRRMRDIEYCSSIIILAREGIVDQTTGKKLNETYEDLKIGYTEKEKDLKYIASAMEIIDSFSNEHTLSFIKKKSQMYTMFSVSFNMIENKVVLTETMIKAFTSYVRVYNLFKNDMDISFEDTLCTVLFEAIKKYKLASSEGVNKVGNRVIRFEVINKYCIYGTDEIIDALEIIEEKILEKYDYVEDIEIEEELDENFLF